MVESFYGHEDIDKFIRLTYFPDYSYVGTVVEVGAATPEYLSMSLHFKLNKWRTIVVEPNPTFSAMHRKMENEVYEVACSNQNQDDVDFTIVHANSGKVTDHSFSSLTIKESYRQIGKNWVEKLNKTTIKVNVRTLDYIIQDAKIESIDLLSVDTEGWELEVMQGLTLIKPKVVVLENIFLEQSYRDYMQNIGYKLDKVIKENDIYTQI